MAKSKIRVGVIGAGGNTRKHHIPKLKAQPNVEVVAVANRTVASARKVAKEFGIAGATDDWRAPPADLEAIHDRALEPKEWVQLEGGALGRSVQALLFRNRE